MPIGIDHYTTSDLSVLQRKTLYRAARAVADRYMHDLELLTGTEVSFEETSMADDLPRKHLRRYNRPFARMFLVCTLAVAQKLREPGLHMLACTAEEVALHAIVKAAEALILGDPEMDHSESDFGEFRATAFEDWDYEMLFDPADERVEDNVDPKQDVVNLRFEDWFNPFRDDVVVHPFLDEGQSDTSALLDERQASA